MNFNHRFNWPGGRQDMTTPGWLLLRAQVLAVIVGLVSCLWLDNVRAAETGKADVVLWHGKIYTAKPAQSFQQAIAFTGNSIIAVGEDTKVKPLIEPGKTAVIDLGGKLVLPGLIDTHVPNFSYWSGGRDNVRNGSLADFGQPIRDVRFVPESRHPHRRHQCLRSANSGRPSADARPG